MRYRNVVLVTPEDASFDSCIVGDENHLNLSLSAPCPLIPRAGFKYESSCSVVLDESGIKNLGCVPCYWKERIEAMCYPSVNEGLHHCCCRTPNCNKRLMEDAVLGWSRAEAPNGTCLSASLKSTRNGLVWLHRPPEKCSSGISVCTTRVHYVSEEQEIIRELETGCMLDSERKLIASDAAFGANPCEHLPEKWFGGNNKTAGSCCAGSTCSRKYYRGVVFRVLQRTRLKDENHYMKLLEFEEAHEAEHIWVTDPIYFAAQSILGVSTTMRRYTSTCVS